MVWHGFALTGIASVLCGEVMKAIIPLLALLSVAGPSMAEETPVMRFVVLDNENLLTGEVTRVEEGWQIRQPVGGDLVLPAKRVLAVVDDRAAAFAVVAKRANLRDADERLRLARWCARQELMDEAIRQAEMAVKMRDNFKAATQYLATLQLSRTNTTPTSPAPAPTVVQAKGETPSAVVKVTEVPSIDYNSETYPFFSTRVHSILLNACASCHARDDIKGYKLQRLTGKAAIGRNLMTSLAQINPNDPAKSPILVKALTPHGNAGEAPFKTRNHPAYQTLESWVLAARSPDAAAGPAGSAIAKPDVVEPKKLPDLEKTFEAATKAGDPNPKPAANQEGFGTARSKPTPEPKNAPAADPFDPAEFNKSAPRKE